MKPAANFKSQGAIWAAQPGTGIAEAAAAWRWIIRLSHGIFLFISPSGITMVLPWFTMVYYGLIWFNDGMICWDNDGIILGY